jgi:DNA-directed RNA polymerase specialized sigma24 family protein
MSSKRSVTRWIHQLKAGDEGAAQNLWERYHCRLLKLALKKLRSVPRRAADEDDVVVSAFASFCRAARQGRFAQLRDRDNLWPLLVVITARKAADLQQHERREKRGGGKVRGESALAGPPSDALDQPGFEQIVGHEPTPAFAVQVAEECRRRLAELGDDVLRSVALWKMEGYSSAEIAGKLGCVVGTVERKLRVIRNIWGKEGGP